MPKVKASLDQRHSIKIVGPSNQRYHFTVTTPTDIATGSISIDGDNDAADLLKYITSWSMSQIVMSLPSQQRQCAVNLYRVTAVAMKNKMKTKMKTKIHYLEKKHALEMYNTLSPILATLSKRAQ